MKRIQIQLPEPLYKDLKHIAAQNEWSFAEVIRRAGELLVANGTEQQMNLWLLPEPFDLGGDFLSPPETFRAEAEVVESNVLS